jgi:hypothetical protein
MPLNDAHLGDIFLSRAGQIEKGNEMKIKQLIKHWFRCRHGSVSLGLSFWSVTACNGYVIETEQKCLKCGVYRHRVLKFGCRESAEWQDGKHPESTNKNPASGC